MIDHYWPRSVQRETRNPKYKNSSILGLLDTYCRHIVPKPNDDRLNPKNKTTHSTQ